MYDPDLETQPISMNNQVEHREKEETEPINLTPRGNQIVVQ